MVGEAVIKVQTPSQDVSMQVVPPLNSTCTATLGLPVAYGGPVLHLPSDDSAVMLAKRGFDVTVIVAVGALMPCQSSKPCLPTCHHPDHLLIQYA